MSTELASHMAAEPFSSARAYLSIRMFGHLICQQPSHATHSWEQTPVYQASKAEGRASVIYTEEAHCCLKQDAHHCVLTGQAILQHIALEEVCAGSVCVCFLV